MKLAIVTACPSGKVSSVLSARLLEAAALRQGWETSVEIIDPNKADQQLSPEDIEAADLVLVVNTGPVDLDRLVGKRLFSGLACACVAGRRWLSATCCERSTGACRRAGCRAASRQQCRRAAAYRGDHGLSDRRGAHVHGRRGDSASRQAPELRFAGRDPGLGRRAQPAQPSGDLPTLTWCCWQPTSRSTRTALPARKSTAVAPGLR